MADGKVLIEVDLNDDGVNKALSRVEDKAISSSNKIGNSVNKLSEQSVNMAKNAALGILAIAGAFGGFSIKAAGDLQATNAQFDAVFSGMEENASKSVDKIAKDTGMLPSRLKGTFTQMAAFAKTTGLETADALKLTERATMAAADSSAFYDKSIEETTETLQSYLKGNYENDAALGISSTETTRNAAANKLYGKSFNDLEESQKQLTLLQMVEDGNKLAGAFGQAARETNGLENVLGNMKQVVTDVAAAFGAPLLAPFIAGAKGAISVLSGFAKALTANPALVYAIAGAIVTLASAFGAVYLAANKMKILASIQSGFALLTNPVFLVVLAIGALVTAFVYFYKTSEKFRNIIQKIVSPLKALSPYIDKAKDKIKELFDNSVFKNASSIGDAITKLVDKFVAFVKPIAQAAKSMNLVEIAFTILKAAALTLLGPIGLVIKIVELVAKALGGGDVQNGIQKMLDGFSDLASGVKEAGGQVGASVGDMLAGILTAIGAALPGIISGALSIIAGFISGLAQGLPQVALAATHLILAFTASMLLLIPTIAASATLLIVALLGSLAAGLPQIILAGINLIVSLVAGLTAGIPQFVIAITNLIVVFLASVTANLPRILLAGTNLLIAFLQGLIDNLPKIVETVGTLITTFLDAITEKLPSIITSGTNLLVAWLQGIANNLPDVITAAVDVIVAFLSGIANNLPRIITAAVSVIVAFLNGIANNLPRIIASAVNLIVAFLRGIASQIGRIVSAAMDLVDAMVRGILQAQGRLTSAIITLMNGLARNIEQSAPQMKSAAGRLLRAIIEAFPGGGLVTAGYDLMSGLARGIGNAVGNVISKAKEVAGNIIGAVKGAFDINSPSKVFEKEIGVYLPQGIAVGMEKDTSKAVKAARLMASKVVNSIPSAEMAMGINAKMSTSISSVSGSAGSSNASSDTSYSEMVKLLKQLVNKDGNVYFNDALIGTIGPGVDTFLGTETTNSGRWG
ncbi:phage tail protein [Carnobacterium jeotgali]|uniref:phage tail protein n=1 Tax=Carnobacterium jeotgali TaxID=545534 RepID=UPI000690CC6F|nr:hypothetical protein [Carnobacterium jeotgali]